MIRPIFTLLLVENFAPDREQYRRYLSSDSEHQYQILEAETAIAGLELCRSQPIDGILLDYLLPDKDGLAFLESLHAQSNGSSPPVVMVTGQGDERVAVRAIKLGAEDYLVKRQLTPTLLCTTMRSAIENARLRQQIQHCHNRFQVSIENMLDCFGIFSAIRDATGQILDFRIDYLNAAALEVNRMTPMAIGQGLCELLPAHRETGLFEDYCRVVETGTPLIKESLTYADVFGTQQLTRAFDIRASQLDDGFVASWRDVTDKKRACQALEQQARLLEMVDDAVIVRDRQSAIVSWNRAAEELYGWQRQEALGNVTHTLLQTQFSAAQTNVDAILLQAGRWEGELTHTCKDGSLRVVESRQGLVQDEAGRPTGFLEVNRDMTRRQQTEAALRESDRRFREIFNTIYQFVGLLTPDGILLEANQTALNFAGLTREDVIGRPFWEARWWTRSPQTQHQLQAAIQRARVGEFVRYEVEVLGVGETTTTIDFSLKPVYDDSGQVVLLIPEGRDISDRKQAEAERDRLLAAAEAANRSKDEFVALVAHELRSPLNSILGWAKLLRGRTYDATITAKALETIERNTLAQAQLVEDLLDMSRIVSGKLSIVSAPVNLANVITAAIEMVQLQAQAKQIALHAQLALAPQISGDSNRLQQIIVNLLTNAIKFTPEGGQVTIDLTQVDSQVQICVCDTGKGIAPEFLPHMFERFQQGQISAGSKDGLGLGLAIVKNLVELHHGTITADSPGLEQGATFTLCFPMLSTPAIVPVTMPRSLNATSLAGIRVLVVDDEPDMLNLIAFVLEEYGAEVQSALNAVTAIDRLSQFQPDIILSDLAMPGGTGYDLIQEIRRLEVAQPEAIAAPIPAIALTAYASVTYEERSLQAGFQRHLTKPVAPEILVTSILDLTLSSR